MSTERNLNKDSRPLNFIMMFYEGMLVYLLAFKDLRSHIYPQCILVAAHTQGRLWFWVSMKDFMLNKARSGGHSSAHCGG